MGFIPTCTAQVAWTGQLTGVFVIGTSTIDGTDVIAGDFGNNVFDNILSDSMTIRCSRGRANDMSAMNQGQCTIQLTDDDGTYNPENAGGSLSSYLVPMRPVRIRETYGGTVYGLFYGFISRIEHDPTNKQSVIQAVDLTEWLAHRKPTIATQTNKTVSQLIGTILDDMGWTDPAMRDLSTGGDIIPTWSADGTKAGLQLIDELLATDLGTFFIDGDGKAIYRTRSVRWANGSVAYTFTDSTEGGLKTSIEKDKIINGQTVTRFGGTAQTVTDATSRKNYGYRDGPAIQSDYIGSDSQAASLAGFIVATYKDPRPPARSVGLINSTEEWLTQQLTREIGDLVQINQGGANYKARVQAIAHSIDPKGNIKTDMTVEKVTISAFTIGTSVLDGVDVLAY